VTKNRGLALSLVGIVTSLTVVQSVGVAEAACNGNGNPFPTVASFASEGPNSGTCDGLNDYNGYVTDTKTDGWKVRIETRYINGNNGWVPTANTSGTISVNYTDNNSFTQYRMVRADGLTASIGSNQGF
jgi:hypothetical protein